MKMRLLPPVLSLRYQNACEVYRGILVYVISRVTVRVVLTLPDRFHIVIQYSNNTESTPAMNRFEDCDHQIGMPRCL
jgi:hypothetical protein